MISGNKIVVGGLGISGLWIARYFAGRGADVTVSENKPETHLDPGVLREINALGLSSNPEDMAEIPF